jgi:hypothetical protein
VVLIVSGLMIEVSRKDVKTLRLYVKPPDGKVTVSAPFTMTNEAIELFIHSKVDWIKHHVQKFSKQQSQTKQKYVSGETFYVWGEEYNLQVKKGGKNSIVLSDDTAVFTVRRGSSYDQREKYVRKWYRNLLEIEVERLLPKWEKKTGLKAEGWQTRYMTSRWGSCKIKQRKICLNIQLAKRPVLCLEYILLHELIHFVEKGHNQRFKSLLDKHMPEWRKVKPLLTRLQ